MRRAADARGRGAARPFTRGWWASARWSGRRTWPTPSCGASTSATSRRARGRRWRRSWREVFPAGEPWRPGAGAGPRGRDGRRRRGAARASSAPALEVVARRSGRGARRGDRADLAAALPPAWSGRFDLIVAAHLLNELFVDRAERRARRRARAARARLGRGAAGARAARSSSSSRRCARRRASCWPCATSCWRCRTCDVVAPCFWTGACPALARERDWCHDAAPGVHAGSAAPRASTSATWCCATGGARCPAELRYRVVSDPLPEKGRLKLYGLRPDRAPPVRPAGPPRIASQRRLRRPRARRRRAHRRRRRPPSDGMRVEPTTAVAIRSPRPAKRGEADSGERSVRPTSRRSSRRCRRSARRSARRSPGPCVVSLMRASS